MTEDEAKKWDAILANDEPRRLQILMEHQSLKRHLCERTLLVATGADDWVLRSIRRAENLHESESGLRKLVAEMTAAIEGVKQRTNYRECPNCMGRGTTSNEESCVCCGGTGVRRLS